MEAAAHAIGARHGQPSLRCLVRWGALGFAVLLLLAYAAPVSAWQMGQALDGSSSSTWGRLGYAAFAVVPWFAGLFVWWLAGRRGLQDGVLRLALGIATAAAVPVVALFGTYVYIVVRGVLSGL